MPELPEVETVVRGLQAPLIGRTFAGVWYDRSRVINTPSPEQFAARIRTPCSAFSKGIRHI